MEKGPDWAPCVCQAQKHGPKSKPQYGPQCTGLFPSCPICWPAREEEKSMSRLPTKGQECLSPSPTVRRQTWGATADRRGTGRTGENPHGDSLPKVPGSSWSGVSVTRRKLPPYMASFSRWEYLLSFISVSWMYRITLVSARRENVISVVLVSVHLAESLLGTHARASHQLLYPRVPFARNNIHF